MNTLVKIQCIINVTILTIINILEVYHTHNHLYNCSRYTSLLYTHPLHLETDNRNHDTKARIYAIYRTFSFKICMPAIPLIAATSCRKLSLPSCFACTIIFFSNSSIDMYLHVHFIMSAIEIIFHTSMEPIHVWPSSTLGFTHKQNLNYTREKQL